MRILTITANPAVDAAYYVERLETGEVNRPLRAVVTAGGKALNLAKVAACLGEDVTAMGFVGGVNGDFIKSETEKLGINCAFTRIEGDTRKNINIIDSEGTTTELLEYGPCISSAEKEAFMKQYAVEVKCHDVICIGGSLPTGLDGSFYCELIRLGKENGKRVIADVSGKALEEVIGAKPFMIKPNKPELKELFGRDFSTDADVKDALLELYRRGIELPFVTLGKDGAMVYDGERCYKFSVPRLSVKNTVGSGDSTLGGIVTGLNNGMSIIGAIKLGMAAGMANTQSEQSGTVAPELVDSFYKEVTVTEI